MTHAALAAVEQSGAHIPSTFWYEVLYSLSGLELRGIVRRAEIDDFLADAIQMDFRVDIVCGTAEVIDLHNLARQHSLSIYDAAYLELALRLGLPLATRDVALARAATEAGVALFTA